MRLHDHYAPGEFLDRLSAAQDAPHLTDHDWQFLADIESKFDQYGERMFFSDAQADYLDGLSARGGYDCEIFEDDDYEIITAERMGKRRRSVT